MANAPIKDTIRRSASSSWTRSATSPRSISKEIQLAKSELKVSVSHGGLGIGLFAGAAFLGLLAVIMLSVSIAYFIHWRPGLDLHWAFLIVFGLYVVIAALLGLRRPQAGQAGQGARAGDRAGQADPQGLQGQGLTLAPQRTQVPVSTGDVREIPAPPTPRPGSAVSA